MIQSMELKSLSIFQLDSDNFKISIFLNDNDFFLQDFFINKNFPRFSPCETGWTSCSNIIFTLTSNILIIPLLYTVKPFSN